VSKRAWVLPREGVDPMMRGIHPVAADVTHAEHPLSGLDVPDFRVV